MRETGCGVGFINLRMFEPNYSGEVQPQYFFFLFFWSGLQGPKAYSLWYGVVPKPSIG